MSKCPPLPFCLALLVCLLSFDVLAGDLPPSPPGTEGEVRPRVAVRLARLAPSAHVVATPHFVVASETSARDAKRLAAVLEAVHDRIYRAFADSDLPVQPVGEELVWLVFKERNDFEAYGRRVDRRDVSSLDGYYSPRTNRVALSGRGTLPPVVRADTDAAVAGTPAYQILGNGGERSDLRRISHEAVHQIAFNSGLQARGVTYPFWVSEGLATNFEFCVQDLDRAEPRSQRAERLVTAWRCKRLVPVEQFALMTEPCCGSLSALHDRYAQAWGFYRFLSRHRSEQLSAYLATLSALEPGRRSPDCIRREFQEAFGSMSQLAREWHAFLLDEECRLEKEARQEREQQRQEPRQADTPAEPATQAAAAA